MYYELPVQAEQPQPQPQPHQQQHQQQQHQPELQNTYQQIKHIQQQQQMLQHQFHNQNNQLRQQHPNQFQNQNQNQNQNQTKTPYSQQSQFSPTHSNFNLSPAKQLNSNVGSMHLSPLKKQLPNTPTKQPLSPLNGVQLYHQTQSNHYTNKSKNHHHDAESKDFIVTTR